MEDRLRLLALAPGAAVGSVAVQVRRVWVVRALAAGAGGQRRSCLLLQTQREPAAPATLLGSPCAPGGPPPPSFPPSPQVRAVPLRRTAELARLRGLRLAASLALEASDLAAPWLRALWRRASALLSFLLVGLIGRAIGLVWQGIRQGMARGAGGSSSSSSGKSQRRQQQSRPPGEAAGGEPTSGIAAGSTQTGSWREVAFSLLQLSPPTA